RIVREDPLEQGESRSARWLSQHLPVTRESGSGKFLVREDGKLVATPLLVALLAIEVTDIAFAVDSVPAAFAVSREPFIVYTSNILALLGLRSLYLVLAGVITELRYLHYGLAFVL